MEPCVCFPDDAILDGVAPPEGFLMDQPEETVPESALLASPNFPTEEAAMEVTALVGGLWRTEYFPGTM